MFDLLRTCPVFSRVAAPFCACSAECEFPAPPRSCPHVVRLTVRPWFSQWVCGGPYVGVQLSAVGPVGSWVDALVPQPRSSSQPGPRRLGSGAMGLPLGPHSAYCCPPPEHRQVLAEGQGQGGRVSVREGGQAARVGVVQQHAVAGLRRLALETLALSLHRGSTRAKTPDCCGRDCPFWALGV